MIRKPQRSRKAIPSICLLVYLLVTIDRITDHERGQMLNFKHILLVSIRGYFESFVAATEKIYENDLWMEFPLRGISYNQRERHQMLNTQLPANVRPG